MNSRLSKIEKKMKVGKDLASKNVEQIKKLARDHNSKVKESQDNYQQIEYHFDIEAHGKELEKLKAS